VLVYLLNQDSENSKVPHECDSQSGSALGNHWALVFALSPICENVFHTQTHSLGPMSPCTPHLIANPMLKLQQLDIS